MFWQELPHRTCGLRPSLQIFALESRTPRLRVDSGKTLSYIFRAVRKDPQQQTIAFAAKYSIYCSMLFGTEAAHGSQAAQFPLIRHTFP